MSRTNKADKEAWKAAHEAARKVLRKEDKEHKYSPLGSVWYEISGQLRRNGDWVDVDSVNVWWTTESEQRKLMRKILKQAGFKQDGDNIFRWKDEDEGKDGKKAEEPAAEKKKAEGKSGKKSDDKKK